MNQKLIEIKTNFFKKKLIAMESINSIFSEVKVLAKDETVVNTLRSLKKIEYLISNFNFPNTNQLIKGLSNTEELKKHEEELKKINKSLEAIAKKDSTVKISDVIKWPSKASEAIPVVLTNKFKEDFYDALKSFPVYFGGGGGNVDTSKLATSALHQQLINAINNIEINADSINLNTDDLEEKLDTLIQGNTDGSQVTQIKENSPTDTTKVNASVAITESVEGTVTTKMITKTIGALSYVKQVVSDSSDNSVTVSSWSVLA